MHECSAAYRNKTVAVTGSSGYIGCALVDALRQTPAQLLLVSRRPSYVGRVPRRAEEHRAADPATPETLTNDVRDAACWRQIVGRADIIFHLAGNTSVHAAALDPAESFRATVLPVAHLIAAARDLERTPRIVLASTATVYGLTERVPVAEDRSPNPVTMYDLHKWFGEQQLALATRQGVLDGVSLRLANVYGPSPGTRSADDRGVLTSVVRRALDGSEIPIYGDGRYLRDYVYIDDVVRAMMLAGVHGGMGGQMFNVASGQGITVGDAFHLVAERAARVMGHRSRARHVAWPDEADPIECRNFVADIRRIASVCGWTPRVSLVGGIDRLIESLITSTA